MASATERRSTGQHPQLRGGPDAPEKTAGQAAIDSAAEDQKLTPEEHSAAMDWLMSSEPEEAEAPTHTFEINVGTSDAPNWLAWTIRSLDSDTLREIGRAATSNTQRRRGMQSEPDAAAQNRRIVVAGTVEPDLVQAAQMKGVADPTMVLKHRFHSKPGLVDQIAAEILLFSGYEEDDLRDAKEVRAGKN